MGLLVLTQKLNSFSFPSPPSHRASTSASSYHVCRCFSCWYDLTKKLSPNTSRSKLTLKCPILRCHEPVDISANYGPCFMCPYQRHVRHVIGHIKQQNAYHCPEDDCSVKVKAWSDLRRHITNEHCFNPTKFPCKVPWCKRSGDNGFTRKDKLRDHVRNTHEKGYVPGRANRPIKPAVRSVKGAGSKA